jgi:prolyl oligopeptidase PreP (S9A serine peptidase family)
MKIHEYQAKEILKKAGVPIPKGRPAFSPDEAEAAAKALIAETDNDVWEHYLHYYDAVVQGHSLRPNDLWVHSVATSKSHQVTHSLIAGMRSDDMVEPYLVHYPSKDGKWSISAFVYVPYNLPRNGQHPAIVYVHGGPTAQTVNSFNRFVQHVANQGYIVIAPNYRGSTGYGKEFQHANLFDMGGGDLQDVLAAADYLNDIVAADRKLSGTNHDFANGAPRPHGEMHITPRF